MDIHTDGPRSQLDPFCGMWSSPQFLASNLLALESNSIETYQARLTSTGGLELPTCSLLGPITPRARRPLSLVHAVGGN